MAQSYRGTARLSSNVYFFQHAGARLLPGPYTMWGVLKPGASAAKNIGEANSSDRTGALRSLTTEEPG